MRSWKLGLAAAVVTVATSAAGIAAASSHSTEGPSVPPGVTAGFMVFDRVSGTVTAEYNAHQQFRSASLVKILLALDYLQTNGVGKPIPPDNLALLQSMLRSSDDDAANTFWGNDGGVHIVERMIAQIGLAESAPPPPEYPGFWGYTAFTASDVVKIYRYLFDRAEPTFRDFIIGNLDQSTQCAADGNDQYFGIPRAVPRPWAVKQGWSGFGDPARPCVPAPAGRPPATASPPGVGQDAPSPPPSVRTLSGTIDLTQKAMHTSGVLGADHRTIMVVLTLDGVHTPWADAAANVTTLAKAVYQAGRS
jgi:hypothetical protein